MSTTYLIMLVFLVIYIPIYFWVWKFPEKAKKAHLVKYGPCIMIKTHIGMKTINFLSKYKRTLLFFGLFSRFVSVILFFFVIYLIIIAVIMIPSRLGTYSMGIEYTLVIPGLNPILPLGYSIIALILSMIVHELGHGVQARANDARINSTGLLYAVVPIGAFVEPNEEDMLKKSRRAQVDVYTAGIAVNTIFSVISISLMMMICGGISSHYENDFGIYSIDKYSPIGMVGIPSSAIITGIKEFDSSEDFMAVNALYVNGTTSINIIDSNNESYNIDLFKSYIVEYEYRGIVYNTSGMPIRLGAFIDGITNDSCTIGSGMKVGEYIYSIAFNGDEIKIHDPYEFIDFMKSTLPGDVITITTISSDDSRELTTYNPMKLAGLNGHGYLGIIVNMSGMTMITPENLLKKASDPFYGATTPTSYVQSLFSYLSGPFDNMDPIPDDTKWWYDIPFLGNSLWTLITLLYWIFWINILLAISNALPAYPFDGGFIFYGGINWFLEKCGMNDIEHRKNISESISKNVSTLVLFAFALVLVSFIV